MTNLEQYARSVQMEKWWGYFFCRGCEACPAQAYCHAQPSGTCCRENFLQWAKTEAAEPPNDPLTLEELRGMDGDPVWVEHLNGDIPWGTYSIVWCTMRSATNGYVRFPLKKYGKTWLAYRRKPDGGGE